MKKIKITCKGSEHIPIEKLKHFQGNLKTLGSKERKKIEKSILKYGFSFPVFVWQDNILDGHQRIYVVNGMIENGYTIDDIPVVEIDAENEKEAAEKLLLISSRYGKITMDGFEGFVNDYDIEINDMIDMIDFPDIDLDNLIPEIDNEISENREEMEDIYNVIIECENEQEQIDMLKKLEKQGIKCRALIS